MNFNVKKCKVMHIGKNNMKHKYTMSGMELQSTKAEKDLGVVMSSDLKSTDHCLLFFPSFQASYWLCCMLVSTAYKHTTKPVGCLE